MSILLLAICGTCIGLAAEANGAEASKPVWLDCAPSNDADSSIMFLFDNGKIFGYNKEKQTASEFDGAYISDESIQWFPDYNRQLKIDRRTLEFIFMMNSKIQRGQCKIVAPQPILKKAF